MCPAQSAKTPSLYLGMASPVVAVIDAPTQSCGSAATTETTPNAAAMRRSKLIEDYRNAKPRSNRRCLIEAELRRVTHEVLSCAS